MHSRTLVSSASPKLRLILHPSRPSRLWAAAAAAACAPCSHSCGGVLSNSHGLHTKRWLHARPDDGKGAAAAAVTGLERRPARVQDAHLDQTDPGRPNVDPNQLVAMLDPFLPLVLRISDLKTSIRSPEDLPERLYELREHAPRGLLANLVPGGEHWETFVFVAQALADLRRPPDHSVEFLQSIHGKSPWWHQVQNQDRLALLMQEPLSFHPALDDCPVTQTLAEVTSSTPVQAPAASSKVHVAMGEVWLALGRVIIEATQAEESKSSDMMDHAFRVIAHLHSLDHVPPAIYEYESDDVSVARRKPPFLHVMSSRMMTALSDATWRAQRYDMSDIFDFNGGTTEPFDSDALIEAKKSRLHRLSNDTWLEFVLWCCVKNGHFSEAGVLLAQLFSPASSKRWSALSWEEVLQLQTDHHRRHQSWFDQVASLAEGWSESKPLIEMPPNSISSEVVQVVFDNLLARAHESSGTRDTLNSVMEIVVGSAIEGPTLPKSLEVTNSVIQVLDLAPIDATAMADLYMDSRNYTDGANHNKLAVDEDSEPDSLATCFARDSHSPFSACMAVALDQSVTDGMIARAEALLDCIQRLRDAPMAGQGAIRFSVEIPDTTLAEFLDLALRNDRMETARSLLYDSKLFHRSAATNPTCKPALLRASLAFSDYDLLGRTLENLNVDYNTLSNDLLEALLEAQIRMSKLESIGPTMQHLCRNRRIPLSPRLTTMLAAKLLDQSLDAETDRQQQQATRHLRKILGRLFIPPRDPSQPPDYAAHRQISQLARIFASAGGKLATLAAEFAEVSNKQLSSPAPVPADAFNALLEAVACAQGWVAAQALFERWCGFEAFHEKDDVVDVLDGVPARAARFGGVGEEKVVTPDAASVRAVLWPTGPDRVLRAFYRARAFRQSVGPARAEPRLIRWEEEPASARDWAAVQLPVQVRWAVEQYQRMRMSDKEIEGLIPSLREHWATP